MKLHDAITANLAAAVDADPRDDRAIAIAAWPSVLKSERAALLALNRMLDGEQLTVANIARVASGLGIEVDDLTSTAKAAARAALETQT